MQDAATARTHGVLGAEHEGLTEAAPAKVNLALHVTGRRANGYHNLDTLVVFTEICDQVAVLPRDEPGGRISYDGPFAGALSGFGPGVDLVLRAATALLEAVGRSEARPSFRLTKMLPVAAGLGGGSADAAATLRLLARMLDDRPGREILASVAAGLGADVPMCLASVPLRAEGIGERIIPLGGFPDLPMVLANPGRSVSTAAVFARLNAAGDPPLPALPQSFSGAAEVAGWLGSARNSLEPPAMAIAPEIDRCLAALTADADCLLARMSGSGATCFGIYATDGAAARAAARIKAGEPGWWVVATRSLPSLA